MEYKTHKHINLPRQEIDFQILPPSAPRRILHCQHFLTDLNSPLKREESALFQQGVQILSWLQLITSLQTHVRARMAALDSFRFLHGL